MKKLARLFLAASILGGGLISQAAQAEPQSVISPKMIQYSEEGQGNMMSQVTSVSQFSDVQPTDWAFTSLQSLVERYGCIAGYPDKTYRGQRALTRYEFAAGLNACLDRINELLAAGLADKVGKSDLATLQKLQQEFAAELATIKGRVDALEAKTATLEAQQFSTTTKLTGQAIMAVTGASGAGFNSNTSVISRVRLELNTSFTGEDLLLTRLQTGNGGTTVAPITGTNVSGFIGLGTSSDAGYTGIGPNVTLGLLRYDFSPIKDVRVSIGPALLMSDHFDLNNFANNEASDFSANVFTNNPLLFPINGSATVAGAGAPGAVVNWNPGGGAFSFRVGYAAGSGESPFSNGVTNQGLFGDSYQANAELEFAPKNTGFVARLQYSRASVFNLDYNVGGINVEWAFNPKIAIFGRFGYGGIDGRGIPIAISTNASTNVNPYYWSAGVAFSDLFRPGAVAGIAVGQPFVERNVGNSTQTNVEAYYKFPINSNIAITPDLQFIFNPNNSSVGTITVGTLRTVFTF